MNFRATHLVNKLLEKVDSLSQEDHDRILFKRAADMIVELSKVEEPVAPFDINQLNEHVSEIIRLSQGVSLRLESAEETSGVMDVECPLCNGEGEVPAEGYDNIDRLPFSVEVYGIGDRMVMAKRYVEITRPSVLIPLLERLLSKRKGEPISNDEKL